MGFVTGQTNVWDFELEKQVTFHNFWLWSFEVFQEDLPLSLSTKAAVATGDIMPDTARSKARVGRIW